MGVFPDCCKKRFCTSATFVQFLQRQAGEVFGSPEHGVTTSNRYYQRYIKQHGYAAFKARFAVSKYVTHAVQGAVRPSRQTADASAA